MKYRVLADTGVFVSELCLGAMTFGGRGQMWEAIGGLEQASADGFDQGRDCGVLDRSELALPPQDAAGLSRLQVLATRVIQKNHGE